MNDEDFDQNEFDAVVQELEQERNAPAHDVVIDDDIPDKLRGKSAKDLAKMYLDAEKLIGRQAQEVGEVRKLADELIRSKMQPAQVQQAAPSDDVDEVDFFANPKEAVAKMVANHPAVKQAQAATAKFGKTEAQRAIFGKHPDAIDIVSSADFQAFVAATPVRQKLFNAAHNAYNFEAADELLTTFKELRGIGQKHQETDQQEQFQERNKQALKDAAVSSGGSGQVGRKTYRRADLIRLQMTDPERYEQLQPEIMAAYQEGRVK